MKEYLTKASPEGGATLIQEMASVLQHHENDVNLSPQSRRKRKLARQASLRALKIALTPQPSPAGSPRVSKTSENRFIPTEFPLIASGKMGVSTLSPRGSQETAELSTNNALFSYQSKPREDDDDFHSNSEQIVPEISSYNIDHIYISPYTGKHEYPVTETTSTSPTNTDDDYSSHQHVLSNSTDTLIERTVTPYADRNKKFSTGSQGYSDFIKKGLNSEDIRTPEMGDSQEEDYLHEIPRLTGIEMGMIPILAPPSSRIEPHPVLPSYNEALSSQNRVKSFEDLLGGSGSNGNKRSNEAIHLQPMNTQRNNHSSLATPTYVTTPNIPPQNAPSITNPHPPTTNTGQLITFNLFKSNQGLGFSINKKKNVRKGELNIYVQDLQPGGSGEREGLHKGDYLISINNQKLGGIGLPTAVSLLQQAKGNVELVVYRKEGVTHDGSPSPTMLPWIPQPVTVATNQPSSPKVKVC